MTAQLVRDDDTGFTEPVDQPCQKTSCSIGASLWLNENIKDVAVRVDRPPKPVFSAVDWDDDLIQVPFVARDRSVAPDAIGKVTAKAVHPFSDRFPADRHTPIGEKILDIRRAEREAMIDPDGICNDFTRETVAFQARHGGWCIHTQRLTNHRSANKLAIPAAGIDLLVGDSRASARAGRSVFTHLHASRMDGVICLDGSLPAFARAELDAPDVTERVVFACELMADSDLPFVRSVNRSEGA